MREMLDIKKLKACKGAFIYLLLFLISGLLYGCASEEKSVSKAEIIPQKQLTQNPVQEAASEEGAEKAEEELMGIDKILDAYLTIHFGEREVVVDREVFEAWIQEENGVFSMDEEQVKAYVRYLASRFDTIGTDRQFTTTGGETITVRGGNYGFWMDRESTVKALSEALLEGRVGDFKPVYYCEGVNYGGNEIGDSYVEVDLDNQHVYVYKKGELITEADCVSGKVSSGDFTPDGTFQITYKEENATLRGQGYNSKVKYWMPFNGNIGLHDASWRKEFGGDLYLRGGSHGCVNLPPDKASAIFENVEEGEAVVVYGGVQSVPKEEKPLTKQYLMELLLTEMSAEQIGALSIDQLHALLYEALTAETQRRGITLSEGEAYAIITEGEALATPEVPTTEALPPVPDGTTLPVVPDATVLPAIPDAGVEVTQ